MKHHEGLDFRLLVQLPRDQEGLGFIEAVEQVWRWMKGRRDIYGYPAIELQLGPGPQSLEGVTEFYRGC